jgi:DNA-binding response OmpR family regulator
MSAWTNASELAEMFLANSPPKKSSEIIESGDFRIDLGNHEAKVQGKQLRLTDEEFELLVFLVGHPTSIITPHTRLSTRWERNPVHQAEVLRVLKQLREKLEALGCSRYIRTEPWVVYRFNPHTRHEKQ